MFRATHRSSTNRIISLAVAAAGIAAVAPSAASAAALTNAKSCPPSTVKSNKLTVTTAGTATCATADKLLTLFLGGAGTKHNGPAGIVTTR